MLLDNTHDLAIVDGNLVWEPFLGKQNVGLAESVAQRLRVRFQWVKGEWFLDKRQGIPYLEEVFLKAPNLQLIRSLFSGVLRSTEGVADIDSLELTTNRHTRELLLSFTVRLNDGTVLRSTDYPPFLVRV